MKRILAIALLAISCVGCSASAYLRNGVNLRATGALPDAYNTFISPSPVLMYDASSPSRPNAWPPADQWIVLYQDQGGLRCRFAPEHRVTSLTITLDPDVEQIRRPIYTSLDNSGYYTFNVDNISSGEHLLRIIMQYQDIGQPTATWPRDYYIRRIPGRY